LWAAVTGVGVILFLLGFADTDFSANARAALVFVGAIGTLYGLRRFSPDE
jgi:hypothetical protein